jgi:hypothetical protein
MAIGRRGIENHGESQLESGDSHRSGGNLAVNVDEKADPLLMAVLRSWALIPIEVREAIATICRRSWPRPAPTD